MRHYFAPLEGITDNIYRKIHHKYFPGVDRYYTPFISPTSHRSFTPREQRELQQEDFPVVPQVLTKNADDFLWTAQKFADTGYREINLNLGCPSGTVTAKGKGSGALRDLSALTQFLDSIFAGSPIPISVKTRIGYENPDEFAALLEIYNRYPIAELTVHPRTRSAFYNGNVDMDSFSFAVENAKNPLCFNGNLCSLEEITVLHSAYPSISAVMLGRGLVGDPGMFSPGGTTAEKLEAYHDELLDTYSAAFGSSRNAMFRMKENWHYMICRFDGGEKQYKQLKKTTDINQYRAITKDIFHNVPLAGKLNPNW